MLKEWETDNRWSPLKSQWGFPDSPVVRLHATNAGGPGPFPGQRTGSHMLQLRKIPRATDKHSESVSHSIVSNSLQPHGL